jgi:hypothetical protein
MRESRIQRVSTQSRQSTKSTTVHPMRSTIIMALIPPELAYSAESAKNYLASPPVASYLPGLAVMSWKRAQMHAESMLENIGIGEKLKGRKDLRGKKVIFFDDGANPYRTMCFTVAAKLVKRRGGEVENAKPGPGEASHAKVLDIPQPPRTRPPDSRPQSTEKRFGR